MAFKDTEGLLVGILVLAAAGGLVLGAQATDDQGEKKAVKLGEVVVTATRREIPVEEAPASVTVIDRAEIEASPGEKVDDILRNVPGVFVESHHGLDTPPRRAVFLRGVGREQARTLILVDGIPINNMNNGWVEWSKIPKDNIERIEIVRGPASSLYGSNALGGVINIITRRPTKPSHTVLKFTYGSWDTWTTRLTQSGKFDSFTYYLSGEYYRTHGYIAERERQAYNIRRFRREHNLMGRFTWAPDENTLLTLGLGSHLARRGHGREYFWLDYDSKDGYLRCRRELEGYDLEGTLYFAHERWDAHMDSPANNYATEASQEHIPFQKIGAIVQSSIEVSESDTLTVGGDFAFGKVHWKPEFFLGPPRQAGSEGKQTHFSIFAENELRLFGETLAVTLGGRMDWVRSFDGEAFDTNPPGPPAPFANDYDSQTWRQFNPKMGLVYHVSETTTARATVARGFRAPTLYDLYTSITRGPNLYRSNPDLEPETLVSYELGLDHYFTPNLLGRITAYHSDAKDYIGRIQVGQMGPSAIYQYQNLSQVDIDGVESELRYRFNDAWSGFLSYTYTRSEVDEAENRPDLEGKDLPYTPRHMARLGLAFSRPDLFDFNVQLTYVGRRYSDEDNTRQGRLFDYLTVDLHLAKKVTKATTLALDVQNLFDIEYEAFCGPWGKLLAPGRVITGAITIEF